MKSLPTQNDVFSVRTLDVNEDDVYAKVTKRIIPLLAISFIVAYLDRVNIGFAKLQLQGDLGMSDAAYGFGAGIFFAGYLLFEVPSNLLLHKFGARFWIGRILATWGVISIAFAFLPHLSTITGLSVNTVFYCLRVLLGVAEAGFFPGVILYLNYWYPPYRQSRVTSLYLLALPLSLVLGGPLSGWIMSLNYPGEGLHGWQWLFIIEGIPAVVMGILVFVFLPDHIRSAKWLNDNEKTFLEARLQTGSAEKSGTFGSAVRDWRVWYLALILLTFNTGFYGLSFWLPSILKSAGVGSTLMVGMLSAIPYVFAVVIMIFNGKHSGKTDELRWHAAIPAFVGAAGLLLSVLFTHNFLLAFTSLCFAAAGVLGLMPVFWTIPGRFLTGTAAAGGIAIVNAFGSLSGFAGSTITAVAKDITGDINTGTIVLSILLAISGGLLLGLPKTLLGGK